jgi:outer membrane immunogenic protein
LNFQTGWFVWGIEGTFSAADIKGTAPCGIANAFSCTTDSNWIATLTGRFGGLVADRTLAYIKGGVAWKDTDYSSVDSSCLFGCTTATASDTRFGWLFGAGAEYAFTPNVTAFIEYNYMDFGTENLTYACSGACDPTILADNSNKLHVVKAGLNYRFNWPTGRW